MNKISLEAKSWLNKNQICHFNKIKIPSSFPLNSKVRINTIFDSKFTMFNHFLEFVKKTSEKTTRNLNSKVARQINELDYSST